VTGSGGPGGGRSQREQLGVSKSIRGALAAD